MSTAWLRAHAPGLPHGGDLVAGITVALVLVPQSIAYASLAGLPPEHGLYAAAVAPLFGGLVGSSPYLQTGPVALTSLLVLGALAPVAGEGTAAYASQAALLAVVVGLTRILVGGLRGGFVAYLMSQPVVSAFTFAAAVLITCSQVPAMLGVPASSDNPAIAAARALGQPADWAWAALVVAVAVAATTLLMRRWHPLAPGALLATVGALLAARLLDLGVAQVGPIPGGLPTLDLALPWSSTGALLLPGVVIALVGFAEPASIARRYAGAERTAWDPDREFVGQGLANLGAGLFGGYAVGGSFSRSALNRLSGARTRWSGVLTGATVLALFPLFTFLEDLPRAALAGLVVASVLTLLDPGPVVRTWRLSRPQFAVSLATIAVTLAAAPRVQWGVVAGVVLALAVHLWRELRLDVETWSDGDALRVRPQGVLYFGSAPGLETVVLGQLAGRPELTRVVVELQRLGRIDLTGALVLRAIARDLREAGVTVTLTGVTPQCRRIVHAVFADEPVDYTRAPRPGDAGPHREEPLDEWPQGTTDP